MGSGRLFHKEGPILRQGFLPCVSLAKKAENLFLVLFSNEFKESDSFKSLALKLTNFVKLNLKTTAETL